MSSGPSTKGPRLWLQPERANSNGSLERSRWVIRDGSLKRSTGCFADDVAGAEKALARYIAQKHQPRRQKSDPSLTLIVDVLNIYAQDVAPAHARPSETASRLARLASWWGSPTSAARDARKRGGRVFELSGYVSDIDASTCQAYCVFVGAQRSASRDLELLRAACNHANGQRVLDGVVKVWLPPKSEPRQRWLTRSEVAGLLWAAWKSTRKANGRSGTIDDWHSRRHLARFILLAVYTGSRKQDVLNASFEQHPDRGYIDLDRGVWIRKATSKATTKKRQTPIPLPQSLLAHLRRWKRSGQVFAVEYNGKPVSRIDKAFRAVVAECGLGKDVIPHALRHTGVTWGMQAGMDLWDASGYFGMTTQVLTDVYGHHHPDHLREAAAKMGRKR